MKSFRKKLLLIIICIFICLPCSGIVIKLGSLVPRNSPWDLALRRIAAKWADISNNTIELRIYAGGIVGNEEEMIRKMRIGQLNAAALSGLGINTISPSILTLYIPFLIRTDEEVDYILNNISDEFNDNIEENGYKVVSWIMGGWIYLFSRERVVTPEDLMAQKLLIPPNDQDMVQAWRQSGFTVVELALTDIMIGLQTSMIDAFYSTPIVASFELYNYANNMCAMKFAPLVGGFVITNSTWSRIPDDIKPLLLESANNILEPLYEETKQMEQEIIESMIQYGLNINPVNEQEKEQWQEVVDIGFDLVIGKTIPVDIYEKVNSLLLEYRENQ